MRTTKREALYFAALFVLPFLVFIALDLTLIESSLPPHRRLCAFQDVCAYGYCWIYPGLLYVGSRVLVLLLP
jgi:hypothetical protein